MIFFSIAGTSLLMFMLFNGRFYPHQHWYKPIYLLELAYMRPHLERSEKRKEKKKKKSPSTAGNRTRPCRVSNDCRFTLQLSGRLRPLHRASHFRSSAGPARSSGSALRIRTGRTAPIEARRPLSLRLSRFRSHYCLMIALGLAASPSPCFRYWALTL